MSNRRSRYGRDARMRSWAFFIFEAATISIALVILRVLCTLLILLRISLEPAIRLCARLARDRAMRSLFRCRYRTKGDGPPRAFRASLTGAKVGFYFAAAQNVPVFLKSSIAAASAFSSSPARSFVCSILSMIAAYLLFMNWRSEDSNASAFSTGTSS